MIRFTLAIAVMVTFSLACATAAASVAVNAPSLSAYQVQGIEKLDEMSDALEDLLAERAEVWQRDETWLLRSDRSRRLNILLDRAVEILADGEVAKLRERIGALRERLRGEERRLADFRSKLAITLPSECADEGDGVVNRLLCEILPDPRASLERRIEQTEASISSARAEIAAASRTFSSSLREINIVLSSSEVEVLLSTVTADELIEMHVVYSAIRGVQHALARAAEAGGDVEVIKRYYGFSAALLEIVLHMQEGFLSDISDRWLPRLDELQRKAAETRKQAVRLHHAEADPDLREQLQRNQSANALTIEAARLYRDYLADQSRQVVEQWKTIRARHKVALNSYRTFAIQSDVLAVLDQSAEAFRTLMEMPLPMLKGFDGSAEIKREIERLSEQLRESAA